MSDAKTGGGGLGDLLSLGLGSAEPEVRKAAQKLASRVPADSFMRTQLFERLFGAARQFAERKLEGLPSTEREILERLTDFGDIFSAELARQGSRGSAESATSTTLKPWQQTFFAAAQTRIMKAQPEEKEKIKAAIILEYRLIVEVEKLLEESAPKPAEKPATPTTTPTEAIKVSNDEWEADLKKRREAAKATRPGLLRKFLADFGITWGKKGKTSATQETKSEPAGDKPSSAARA